MSQKELHTPDSIKDRSSSYKNDAWKQYTAEELYWWVRLLSKRAGHRTEREKIEKDMKDAQAYLDMLGQHGELLLLRQGTACIHECQQIIGGR